MHFHTVKARLTSKKLKFYYFASLAEFYPDNYSHYTQQIALRLGNSMDVEASPFL